MIFKTVFGSFIKIYWSRNIFWWFLIKRERQKLKEILHTFLEKTISQIISGNLCKIRLNLKTLELLKFYLVGVGLGNLVKADRCLGLVKCFTIFHFNWNSWKWTIFRISILPSIALQRRNFLDNLDFKGKIVAKFLIRSDFLSI